jgi:hypothetical protein
MNNSVIAIQSFVITTIVYALLVPVFFEIDNVLGEIENSTDNNNSKPTNDTKQQQVIESQCKSPCPSNAEMCIEMCA